jgi:hypothetical protein
MQELPGCQLNRTFCTFLHTDSPKSRHPRGRLGNHSNSPAGLSPIKNLTFPTFAMQTIESNNSVDVVLAGFPDIQPDKRPDNCSRRDVAIAVVDRARSGGDR